MKRLCLLLPLFLLLACSVPTQYTGGTTDTGNAAIACTVYAPGGGGAAGAGVILRRGDYLADGTGVAVDGKETVTDAAGRFRIDSLDTGRYTIEVNDAESHVSLLLSVALTAQDTLLTAPGDTLRPYATIRGTLSLPATALGQTFVQVYGLERFVAVEPSGAYTLSDLPAGSLSVRIFSHDSAVAPQTIDGITTTPGDTVIVPWQQWRYSQRLFLNTTATGADVTNDVLGFPVLVRLTSANFDFSQAAPNGRDLRFVKPDGAPLPCEIERWDAAAEQAEIWVRLDTVHGNSAARFIRMLWGNPAGQEVSAGPAVFDTADGFQGVWHLGQVGSAPAGDATANRFHATAHGNGAAVAGAIGIAQRISDDSTWFEVPNSATGKLDFAADDTFSVSAWAYADTINRAFHLIAGKGHDQYSLKLTVRDPGLGEKWELVNYVDRTGWQLTEDTTARAGVWTHVVGVHSGTRQFLYVNGVLKDSTILTTPGTIARNTSENFSIGRYLRYITYFQDEGYSAFKGRIDEVRVTSTAPSSDWIRLAYANQKAVDGLVVFEKK